MNARNKLLIVVVIIIATHLLGCYRDGSIDATGRSDIFKIVRDSVPYALTGDPMLDYVWEKDSDQYGRKLFLYQTDIKMSTNDLDIWVICQKTNGDRSFYYEDFCYYVCEKDSPILDKELALLKERNDWEKPLDNTKMASVTFGNEENSRGYEYYLQFEEGEKLKEIIRNTVDCPKNTYIYLDGLGCDSNGKGVVFVIICQTDNNGVIGLAEARYLLRYDMENPTELSDFMSIEKGYNHQELIHNFRTGGALSP